MSQGHGQRIMRCGEGHLFTAGLASRLFAVHLGTTTLMPCPVDGNWSMCTVVEAEDLSEEDLEEARRHIA
jgi:hypothetical protein